MSRILNMLAKALPKLWSDGGPRQTAQVEVTKGELIDDVERMQNYGMTSHPPVAGTDCLMVFLGGNREQGVIIAAENRQFRLKGLKSGEVALYDDLGNVVKLGRENIEVIAVTKLAASAPIVEVNAATSASIISGASSITITPSGIELVSASLTHNGKNIGATHYHVGSPPDRVPA